MNNINNAILKRAIGFIFITILIVVAVWLVYAGLSGFFNFESYQDFNISFLASAAEDLLFFLIIGVGLFLLTLRRPEEESLEARISFLFSGKYSTADARRHTVDLVTKHACISPASEIKITIDSYHPELRAFKVTTEWQFTLANMYKDQKYKDDNVPLDLTMDDLEVPGGVYGEVECIRTINTVSGKPKIADFINIPIPITTLNFVKNIPLEINADGKLMYNVRFWHYSMLDGDYWIGVNRYTEELKVVLVNASGEPVFYRTSKEQETRDELQHDGREVIYSDLAIPENTPVILYLHIQKQ